MTYDAFLMRQLAMWRKRGHVRAWGLLSGTRESSAVLLRSFLVTICSIINTPIATECDDEEGPSHRYTFSFSYCRATANNIAYNK